MASEEQSIVKIGEVSYSILELPASETAVVLEQKGRLLGSVDLATLVSDLGKVGKFVRVAYNGVAGYTERQIEIRKIGYDVTKLCDKSAVTVAKFKQASGSILDDLQGTYQFLLDGLEDMALETLHAITEVAKDMAAAAEQLHKDFDDESQEVEKALNNTMKDKGAEEERKKDLEKEAREYATKTKAAAQEKENAEEDFKLYETKYREAEAKQERHESSAANPFKALANAFVSPFTGGKKIFNTDADLDHAQGARQEKLAHLEKMKEERDRRSKALQDIAEFTERIKNCKDDKELAEVAIGALHKAMGGLQNLSAIMMKAALFWKQMQVHCEQLAKEKMQRMITTAMKKPEEARLKVWTSTGFKTQAVKYYAQWVALDDVCAIYMDEIKRTQHDLYAYLTENPTLEESRKNVRELAKDFAKELAMEQKAIEDKNSKDEDERKRLTDGSSD